METPIKALFHSLLVIGSVVALSNCGSSKNEDDSQTGTTVPRQKNAALSFTTLPATTLAKATNPALSPTTSIYKTVTTPVPKLPGR